MLEYGRGKTGDVFRSCSTGTWHWSTLPPGPIADGRDGADLTRQDVPLPRNEKTPSDGA